MSRHLWLPGFGLLFVILVLGGSVVWITETGAVRTFKLLMGAVYTLMGLGFLLLTTWAFVKGQFQDIEGPKFRMLEMEEKS